MKKILYYNLILLLVFSLALPAKGDILQLDKTSQSIYTQKEIIIQRITALSVPPPGTTPKLRVSHQSGSAVAGQKCSNFTKQELTFIQDVGPINLNQSANCFSLKFGVIASQEAIQVTSLPSVNTKIKVIEYPQRLQSPFFSQVPMENSVSVLPSVTIGVLTVGLVLIKRFIEKKGVVQTNQTFRIFAFEQLQVLRC